MLEHRPFSSLGGNALPGVVAKLHFGIGGLGRPEHRPVGDLIVWNDDEFAPGRGVGLHPHANIEIITYVREGAVSHADSLGNVGRTEAGNVQVMSAGTGIRHAEFNHEDQPARVFQIWIRPNQVGGQPSWANRAFPASGRDGRFTVLASGDPADTNALPLRANARLLGATMEAGETLRHRVSARGQAYLVLAKGSARINALEMAERDGVAIQGETELAIEVRDRAEIVLVDFF